MNRAPVILFVYNRPEHTREMLDSLHANQLANETTLFVYCDGPKSNASLSVIQRIEKTRAVVKEKTWCGKVIVIEKNDNNGPGHMVISGVTEVLQQYDKVIVVEDDLLFSPYFLTYMNTALLKYAHVKKVMQVSGYNFPVKAFKRSHSAMFLPLISSWGWGTWKRAWNQLDVNAIGYEALKTNGRLRDKFNLDASYNYADMLIAQMETTHVDAWCIRWWWSVFMNKGITLFPDHSLVENVGWDGSGTHCGTKNNFPQPNWDKHYSINTFTNTIRVNNKAYHALKHYLRTHTVPPPAVPKNLWQRAISFLRRKLNG